MGAAAVMRMWARSRPISWRILAPTAASSISWGSVSHTRRAPTRLPFGLDVPTQPDVAPDDVPRKPRSVLQLVEHRHLELLPDPRHCEEDRRPAVEQVLGHGGQAPGEPRLTSDGDGGEFAHAPLGDVTEGQKRQEPLAGRQVDQGGGAADRPHDVGVRQHRRLGGPRGAARVDERGRLLRDDARRPLFGEARLSLQAGRPHGSQLGEADQERVVQALRRHRTPPPGRAWEGCSRTSSTLASSSSFSTKHKRAPQWPRM